MPFTVNNLVKARVVLSENVHFTLPQGTGILGESLLNSSSLKDDKEIKGFGRNEADGKIWAAISLRFRTLNL